MRCPKLKIMKPIAILFFISLTLIIISSCCLSDSSGGGDSPDTYTASGTYVYESGTGILTATFTYSEFPGCGPGVGVETYIVDSISETTMVWDPGTEDMQTWERDSGAAGDITGTWDRMEDNGNVYELTLDADGSVSLIADIVECSGGYTRCNIKAIVTLHTGATAEGAIVTADGKVCTTSSGTCTINDVTPCGDVFTVTASYYIVSDVSTDVFTDPNGGTSEVRLKFEKD